MNLAASPSFSIYICNSYIQNPIFARSRRVIPDAVTAKGSAEQVTPSMDELFRRPPTAMTSRTFAVDGDRSAPGYTLTNAGMRKFSNDHNDPNKRRLSSDMLPIFVLIIRRQISS